MEPKYKLKAESGSYEQLTYEQAQDLQATLDNRGEDSYIEDQS